LLNNTLKGKWAYIFRVCNFSVLLNSGVEWPVSIFSHIHYVEKGPSVH